MRVPGLGNMHREPGAGCVIVHHHWLENSAQTGCFLPVAWKRAQTHVTCALHMRHRLQQAWDLYDT
jgi:hypothetical protein